MTAEQLVHEVVDEQLCPENLYNDETPLDDLGADSLDRVKVVLEFESRLDIEVPDSMIDSLKNVGDLVELVRRNGKGRISDAYETEASSRAGR